MTIKIIFSRRRNLRSTLRWSCKLLVNWFLSTSLIMYISHRKEFLNLTSRALALRQSKPELLVSFHASEQGSLTFLALKLTCSRLFQSAYYHFPDSVFNIKLHSLHKKSGCPSFLWNRPQKTKKKTFCCSLLPEDFKQLPTLLQS